MLVGLAIFLAAYRRWIPAYYRERFGSVHAKELSAKQFVILQSVLIALLFFGQSVARYADPLLSSFLGHLHVAIGDSGRQIDLWPSFLWVAFFSSCLRWQQRSIERRSFFFPLGGLVCFVSLITLAIWHPEVKQFGWWKVLNVSGVSLSLIAIGLYDHFTLLRLLPKRVADDDE